MRAYEYRFPRISTFADSRCLEATHQIVCGRTLLLRRAVHHGMMPEDRYAKQRKAREKGINGGTKERENPNNGASRLAHVRCDYDVRTGRLPPPARHLGVRQQHLGAKSSRYRGVHPDPVYLGHRRLDHRRYCGVCGGQHPPGRNVRLYRGVHIRWLGDRQVAHSYPGVGGAGGRGYRAQRPRPLRTGGARRLLFLTKSGPGESWCAASRDTGPLVMPSYPLSFREWYLSEARFPRRTPLGFSVNRGSGSPLAPRACSLASTDGYLFAKRAGKACLEVLSSTSSRKKETPFEVLRRGVRGRRSQLCRPYRPPPEEDLQLILLLSYLRRRTAYPRTPAPRSSAPAGRTNVPGPTPPLLGRSFSTVISCLTCVVTSCAKAVGTRISIATRATMAR